MSMSRLQAEVVARIPDAGRYADLAAAWLTQARAEIFPDFDPPDRASGTLEVRREPVLVGGSEGRYSDRAWQRMLDGLAASYPFHVQLLMDAVDERGQATRPDHSATIGVHRNHGQPEWVTFEIEATIGISGNAELDAARPYPGELRWAEFVRQCAIRASACYAHVSDDTEVSTGTALEQATARDLANPWFPRTPEETVPHCREVLRGYSWVTICARELAAVLGGAPALAASGAFDEVTELPDGQVYLRATPTLAEYHGARLHRVLEVLAPVLLAGRPDPTSWAAMNGHLVPDVDAADYR
jgi:hypothetical protein